MTPLQFITSKEFGCCTTSELMAYAKDNKAGFETLKQWAIEEMGHREIPVK